MLCVVGMPGCGKGEFLTVARECCFSIVSMGDAVRAETCRRGLPLKCHGDIAKALREEQGLAAVAYLVVDQITSDCIVDGVRGRAEIEVFRQHVPVEIVAIHASPKARFCRVRKRKRPGDPTCWEEFEERDSRELAFGLGEVIALADYMLINESSKKQFEEECFAFLKTVSTPKKIER